jgi:hypothetical protein
MSWTKRRLSRLRPGESMVYYRGNLTFDAGASKDAPTYAALLRSLIEHAEELAHEGRIKLSQRPATIIANIPQKNGGTARVSVDITEYIATVPPVFAIRPANYNPDETERAA